MDCKLYLPNGHHVLWTYGHSSIMREKEAFFNPLAIIQTLLRSHDGGLVQVERVTALALHKATNCLVLATHKERECQEGEEANWTKAAHFELLADTETGSYTRPYQLSDAEHLQKASSGGNCDHFDQKWVQCLEVASAGKSWRRQIWQLLRCWKKNFSPTGNSWRFLLGSPIEVAFCCFLRYWSLYSQSESYQNFRGIDVMTELWGSFSCMFRVNHKQCSFPMTMPGKVSLGNGTTQSERFATHLESSHVSIPYKLNDEVVAVHFEHLIVTDVIALSYLWSGSNLNIALSKIIRSFIKLICVQCKSNI